MKPLENHRLKKDDGVANVVVMMLILSVVVIAFAVIVAVYLPSQKEISELQHSEDVKEAFLQFSSDVDAVYTRAQTGVYSQTFTLGGGDIQFSTSKSAGTVKIGTVLLKPYSLVNFTYANSTVINHNKTREKNETPGYFHKNLSTITLSYTPVLSFWEDQGYNYSKGVVWVNKKNGGSTPVSSVLYNSTDGKNEENATVKRWIQDINPVLIETNITPRYNKSNQNELLGFDTYYVYSLTLVNFTADPKKNYLSGNGNADLRITAELESEYEYTLDPVESLQIDGETVVLQNGTQHTRLRVTTIDAKVSVS